MCLKHKTRRETTTTRDNRILWTRTKYMIYVGNTKKIRGSGFRTRVRNTVRQKSVSLPVSCLFFALHAHGRGTNETDNNNNNTDEGYYYARRGLSGQIVDGVIMVRGRRGSSLVDDDDGGLRRGYDDDM